MKRYRNEWKYLLNAQMKGMLQERFEQTLRHDEHSDQHGFYTVHSLYFDDFTDSCAAENEAGTDPRAKYRIRCYGDLNSGLHLERKEKYFSRSCKESCPLSKKDFDSLLGGDPMSVFWRTDDQLLRRFCINMAERYFTPKLALSYKRTAYVEPASNVRITFDTSVSAVSSDHGFPSTETSPMMALLAPESCILEVKFDDILPGWLHTMLSIRGMQQVPFSKYYMGRKKLEEVYR